MPSASGKCGVTEILFIFLLEIPSPSSLLPRGKKKERERHETLAFQTLEVGNKKGNFREMRNKQVSPTIGSVF